MSYIKYLVSLLLQSFLFLLFLYLLIYFTSKPVGSIWIADRLYELLFLTKGAIKVREVPYEST